MKHNTSELPTVAAFDFDGTLTYCDTLVPFLCYAFGPLKTLSQLILTLPQLWLYLLGNISRQQLKESILTPFLKGASQEAIKKKGAVFAETKMERLVKKESLKRIQWHRNQGHRCVLVSAGLDLYIKPWAALAGFDDVITSKCEATPEGILTGRLHGLNCWGSEKVRQLTHLLGPRKGYILFAYGNSRGDEQLLEWADHAFYRKLR